MCSGLDMKEGTTHLAGADKQANEVYSKQKLSLKTTQQAVKSMSPLQSKSSTVTSRTSKQGLSSLCPATAKKENCKGRVTANGRGKVSTPLLCWSDPFLSVKHPSGLQTTLQSSWSQVLSSFVFFFSLSILLLASFDLWGTSLRTHYAREYKATEQKNQEAVLWETREAVGTTRLKK